MTEKVLPLVRPFHKSQIGSEFTGTIGLFAADGEPRMAGPEPAKYASEMTHVGV